MSQTSHALVTGALPRYKCEPLDSKLKRVCLTLVSIVFLGSIMLFAFSAPSVASQVFTLSLYTAHMPDLACTCEGCPTTLQCEPLDSKLKGVWFTLVSIIFFGIIEMCAFSALSVASQVPTLSPRTAHVPDLACTCNGCATALHM